MAFARVEAARVLRKVPLFSHCSRRQITDIAAISYEKEFPEGEELTREGERGTSFFVLLDGTADVYQAGTRIRELGAGDFFGEIALLAHTARTATVKTTSRVRALILPDRAFRSLLGRQTEVQLRVLEALAERSAP